MRKICVPAKILSVVTYIKWHMNSMLNPHDDSSMSWPRALFSPPLWANITDTQRIYNAVENENEKRQSAIATYFISISIYSNDKHLLKYGMRPLAAHLRLHIFSFLEEEEKNCFSLSVTLPSALSFSVLFFVFFIHCEHKKICKVCCVRRERKKKKW